MNPDFIYFKEVTLDDNNKFTLAFSDEEFALQINFFTNLDYYIATLNCNLILKKKHIHDKKIEELSQKSRVLFEEGPAYQNDIGWLYSTNASVYVLRNIASLTYNFILYTDLVDDNCYNYKFFDTVEEEIRDCRIYSPFTHI